MFIAKHNVTVPCGRCPQCGASKRADWATRLHYEARKHEVKKFVTLTYANPYLRWKAGVAQLHKRDLQLWFKRIRKLGYKIRYFAVGEYGSKTYRPHYHVILFGDVPDDVLRSCWHDEYNSSAILGTLDIGTVNQASVAYSLGYLVNAKGPQMLRGRVRSFSMMSRKPGIGSDYLDPQMLEWHRSGRKNYCVVDGAERHLPRFYKEKIFSKIDQVRISVAEQKKYFNRMVAWIRHPERMKMKNPLAYYREQQLVLAKKIRAHSKTSQSI